MRVTLIECVICKKIYSCEYKKLGIKYKGKHKTCCNCELGKIKNDCSNLFSYDEVISNDICEECKNKYSEYLNNY